MLPATPLQSTGVQILAVQNPEILAIMVNENYLPPPQLILAIKAFEDNIHDPEALGKYLRGLLGHYSPAVREEVSRILEIPPNVA